MNKTVCLTSISLIAAISSFFSGVLLAKYFGGSGELSGYFAGFNFVIPLNLLLLKAHGKAFIPFISSKSTMQNETASVLLKFNFLLLICISVLILLFSGVLPNVISPGLSDEFKVYVTRTLQILSVYIIAANCFGFFQGVFHFNNVFIKPALLGILPSISLLIVLLSTRSSNVLVLPLTHTIAIVISSILAFILSKHLFFKSHTKIRKHKDEILEYSLLSMPIVLYSIFMWAIKFIDTLMASFIEEESISQLEYARKLVNHPELFTGVFATIYFPILAKLNVQKQYREFNEVFIKGAEKTFLVSATIGMLVLLNSTELISVIYQRGEFTYEDTQVVSGILNGFVGVIVIAPLGTYFSNMYYSMKKTKLVAVLSVVSSSVNILLNYVFVYILYWQVAGIALASSVAYLVGISLQIVFIKKVSPGFSYSELFKPYFKIIGVVIAVFMVAQWGQAYLFNSPELSTASKKVIFITVIYKSAVQIILVSILVFLLNIANVRSMLIKKFK